MSWFPYSIAATILLGIAISLYKIPSFKGYSIFISTIWTNIFCVLFVVFGLFVFNHTALGGFFDVSWYAIAWGGFFAINMVLQKILVSRVETNSAYPVTSSLGSVVTILVGLTLLSESVSLIQTVGIVIILISVFIYTRKDGSFPLDQNTVLLAVGIITSSTITKYLQKLGAITDSISQFMIWQYVGAIIFGSIIAYVFDSDKLREVAHIKKYWKGPMLIAGFTVLGSWMLLKALALGPLSAVFAVHPAYTFVAGIVGYVLFKEKLTTKKILLAILCVLGITLLNIG